MFFIYKILVYRTYRFGSISKGIIIRVDKIIKLRLLVNRSLELNGGVYSVTNRMSLKAFVDYLYKGFLFINKNSYTCSMKNLSNSIFTELNNMYHTYLFIPSNRKKLLNGLLYCFICFGFWLTGYKWRDGHIIIQNIQIEQLSIKKESLKNSVNLLENSLAEYNFMLNDGDYYRYLAFKHGKVLIPKETNANDLKLITEQSKRYSIPLKYIYRLIQKESRYNPNAISKTGAKGYMQVMPLTFNLMKKSYENDNNEIGSLNKNQQNIMIGTYTLHYLHKKYKNWSLTFAAYNAGDGAVDKANGIPNFSETQNYVKYITNI